jgi:P27 family predicted phage terminase small subunit
MPKVSSTKRKELQGTARQDRAKKPLEAKEIAPEPSAGLCSIGRAEFKRVVDALKGTGRLTDLDQTVLSLYASWFAKWKRAEQSLSEDGELLWVEIRDTHGNVTHKKPIVNPMGKVAAEASRLTHRFADALGFSPASRVKQGFEHAERDGEGVMSGLDAINDSLDNFRL